MRRNELYHHGIRGQKWGKRNGPPYPLTKHSAAERKAGLDKTKKKGYNKGKTIERGRYAVGSILEKIGDKPISELSADGLMKNIKMLSKPESVDEVLRNTNPSKSHSNCYNCVVAAAARLCGLDATAKEGISNGKGVSFDEVCRVFKLDPDNPNDVVRVHNPSVERITRQIQKRYSEGDVGAVAFAWSEEYKQQSGITIEGHTLNWVVRDGKAEFADAQVGLQGETLTGFISTRLSNDKEASIAKFGNITQKLNTDAKKFNNFVK